MRLQGALQAIRGTEESQRSGQSTASPSPTPGVQWELRLLPAKPEKAAAAPRPLALGCSGLVLVDTPGLPPAPLRTWSWLRPLPKLHLESPASPAPELVRLPSQRFQVAQSTVPFTPAGQGALPSVVPELPAAHRESAPAAPGLGTRGSRAVPRPSTPERQPWRRERQAGAW